MGLMVVSEFNVDSSWFIGGFLMGVDNTQFPSGQDPIVRLNNTLQRETGKKKWEHGRSYDTVLEVVYICSAWELHIQFTLSLSIYMQVYLCICDCRYLSITYYNITNNILLYVLISDILVGPKLS